MDNISDKELSVISDVEQSLMNQLDTLVDVNLNIAEITFETIIDNDILKEIPIVKTAAALVKTGFAIREMHFAKNFVIFIKELNTGNIDPAEFEKFKHKMISDLNYRNKVLEYLVTIIDRIIKNEKVQILARLFENYYKGKYNWDKFTHFSECTDKMILDDIKILEILYINKTNDISEVSSEIIGIDKEVFLCSCNRLASLGFILSKSVHGMSFGIAPVTILFRISSDGILFYESLDRK